MIDNKGTTSESLDVFSQVLKGYDHKLMLILNKIDCTENISDCLRVYGTLTWNLGRILDFKDMPVIHPMFIPTEFNRNQNPNRNWSLDEFSRTRDKVVKKVLLAPKSHCDHTLNELQSYTEQLTMFINIINSARSSLWYHRFKLWVMSLILCIVLAALGIHFLEPLDPLLLVIPVIFLLIIFMIVPQSVASKQAELLRSMPDIFRTLYAEKLLHDDNPDHLHSTFSAIHPNLIAVQRFGLFSCPNLSKHIRAQLAGLEEPINQLRARVHIDLSSK